MTAKILTALFGLFLIISVQTPASAITVEILLAHNESIKNGREAMHDGRLEDAAYYYEQALNNRSRQVSKREMVLLRSDLCVAYMYMARFEEAIEQCKIGLDLKPNRWETLNNLATAFLIQGDYENAIALYQKALKMNPGSRVLTKNIGIALARAEASTNRPRSPNSPNVNPYQPEDFGQFSGSAAY